MATVKLKGKLWIKLQHEQKTI